MKLKYIRTCFWLLRCISLNNESIVIYLRSMYSMQTLLGLFDDKPTDKYILPAQFKRNICDLLRFFWVDYVIIPFHNYIRLSHLATKQLREVHAKNEHISNIMKEEDDNIDIKCHVTEQQVERHSAIDLTRKDKQRLMKYTYDTISRRSENNSHISYYFLAHGHWEMLYGLSVLSLLRKLLLCGFYTTRDEYKELTTLLHDILINTTLFDQINLSVQSERNMYIHRVKLQLVLVLKELFSVIISGYIFKTLALQEMSDAHDVWNEVLASTTHQASLLSMKELAKINPIITTITNHINQVNDDICHEFHVKCNCESTITTKDDNNRFNCVFPHKLRETLFELLMYTFPKLQEESSLLLLSMDNPLSEFYNILKHGILIREDEWMEVKENYNGLDWLFVKSRVSVVKVDYHNNALRRLSYGTEFEKLPEDTITFHLASKVFTTMKELAEDCYSHIHGFEVQHEWDIINKITKQLWSLCNGWKCMVKDVGLTDMSREQKTFGCVQLPVFLKSSAGFKFENTGRVCESQIHDALRHLDIHTVILKVLDLVHMHLSLIKLNGYSHAMNMFLFSRNATSYGVFEGENKQEKKIDISVKSEKICIELAYTCFNILNFMSKDRKNSKLLSSKKFASTVIIFSNLLLPKAESVPSIGISRVRSCSYSSAPPLVATQSSSFCNPSNSSHAFNEEQLIYVMETFYNVLIRNRETFPYLIERKQVSSIAELFMSMKNKHHVFPDVLRLLIQPSLHVLPSRTLQYDTFETLIQSDINDFDLKKTIRDMVLRDLIRAYRKEYSIDGKEQEEKPDRMGGLQWYKKLPFVSQIPPCLYSFNNQDNRDDMETELISELELKKSLHDSLEKYNDHDKAVLSLLWLVTVCAQGKIKSVQTHLQQILKSQTSLMLVSNGNIPYNVRAAYMSFFTAVHVYVLPGAERNPLRNPNRMLLMCAKLEYDVIDFCQACEEISNNTEYHESSSILIKLEDQLTYVFDIALPLMNIFLAMDDEIRSMVNSSSKGYSQSQKIYMQFLDVIIKNIFEALNNFVTKQIYHFSEKVLYHTTLQFIDCKYPFLMRLKTITDFLTMAVRRHQDNINPAGQFVRNHDRKIINPQQILKHQISARARLRVGSFRTDEKVLQATYELPETELLALTRNSKVNPIRRSTNIEMTHIWQSHHEDNENQSYAVIGEFANVLEETFSTRSQFVRDSIEHNLSLICGAPLVPEHTTHDDDEQQIINFDGIEMNRINSSISLRSLTSIRNALASTGTDEDDDNDNTNKLQKATLFFTSLSTFLRMNWSDEQVVRIKLTFITLICEMLEKPRSNAKQRILERTLSNLGFTELVVTLIGGKCWERISGSILEEATDSALRLGIALLGSSDKVVQLHFMSLLKQPQHGIGIFQEIRSRLRKFKETLKLSMEETVNWTLRYNVMETAILEKSLSFLQLCCENHYSEVQNLLREQKEWDREINILQEVLSMYHVFSQQLSVGLLNTTSRIWSNGFHLVDTSLRMLTEAIQGPCHANQRSLALSKESHFMFYEHLRTINVHLLHHKEMIQKYENNDDLIWCIACHRPRQSSTHQYCTLNEHGCFEGHIMCSDDQRYKCHAYTRKTAHLYKWNCPVCLIYRTERSIMQYLNGLLEGHRSAAIYFAELSRVDCDVLFNLLEYHGSMRSTENSGKFDRNIHTEISLLIYSFVRKLCEDITFESNFRHHAVWNSMRTEHSSRVELFLSESKNFQRDLFLSVEIINRQNELERVYFSVPPLFTPESRLWIAQLQLEIIEECTAMSVDERLKRFLKRSHTLELALRHEENMIQSFNKMPPRIGSILGYLFSAVKSNGDNWWSVTFFTALCVNVMLLIFAHVEDPVAGTSRSHAGKHWVAIIIFILSFSHLFFSIIMIGNFLITKGYIEMVKKLSGEADIQTSTRVVMPKGWMEGSKTILDDINTNEEETDDFWETQPVFENDINVPEYSSNDEDDIDLFKEANVNCCIRMSLIPIVSYHILYFTFSLLAVFVSPYFNAIHLVDIVLHYPVLYFVVEAGLSRGSQIMATIFLGFIIVYLFTTISFLFFQNDNLKYDFGPDAERTFHCNTLFRCFQSHIDLGFTNSPIWYEQQLVAGLTPLYDFTYMIIVNVILVSVITGIIIDTFGEMRNDREKVEERTHNYCFVCGIDRETFNLSGRGFKHHVTCEHNMWAYVYLRHYLRLKAETESTEMTGTESYLHREFEAYSVRALPVDRAFSGGNTNNTDKQQQHHHHLE